MKEIESAEYQNDKKHLVIHYKGKKKPQIIPIESLIKDLKEEKGQVKKIADTYSFEESLKRIAARGGKVSKTELKRAKDFDELSKVAENFINKWGCPHSIVVIQQGSIAFYEGEMARPLKLLD